MYTFLQLRFDGQLQGKSSRKMNHPGGGKLNPRAEREMWRSGSTILHIPSSCEMSKDKVVATVRGDTSSKAEAASETIGD